MCQCTTKNCQRFSEFRPLNSPTWDAFVRRLVFRGNLLLLNTSISNYNMKTPVSGLHHITAISSDVQKNMHFYSTVLGLRFVKKSVNQDDVATYHLYYGNYAGSPGTILTFFPWAGMRRGRPGTGQSYATSFSVPPASLPFWQQRHGHLRGSIGDGLLQKLDEC